MRTACPDTIYAVAGHYFQQNFLAFWRSVDMGSLGRRKPPETMALTFLATLSAVQMVLAKRFGTCALPLTRTRPTVSWWAA